MNIARNILALALTAPAANAFAAALQVSDQPVAALSIGAASGDFRQAMPGGGASSASVSREFDSGPLAGLAVAGGEIFQPSSGGVSSAAHGSDQNYRLPGVLAPDSAQSGGVAGSIPVPAAIWVIGFGFIGVAGIARRRSEMPVGHPADAMDPAAGAATANVWQFTVDSVGKSFPDPVQAQRAYRLANSGSAKIA